MGTKKVTLQTRRIFTEDFKKSRITEYERGQFSVSEIGSLYKIAPSIIYRWIHHYSIYSKNKIKIVEMAESSSQKVKDLQDRIKELERIVGMKQLNIDFLEKMIELAKEEYGIDVKKNFSTPQSDGSVKAKSTK